MPIKKELRHLYPKNWKEIRKKILERAGNKCEFCGVADRTLAWKWDGHDDPTMYKIILTIAHLDHDPTHNDPSNLRALCQTCHNRYDAAHRRANRSHTIALKRDKSMWLDFK